MILDIYIYIRLQYTRIRGAYKEYNIHIRARKYIIISY